MTDKAKEYIEAINEFLNDIGDDESYLRRIFLIVSCYPTRKRGICQLCPPVKGAATSEPGGVVGQIRKEDLQHA